MKDNYPATSCLHFSKATIVWYCEEADPSEKLSVIHFAPGPPAPLSSLSRKMSDSNYLWLSLYSILNLLSMFRSPPQLQGYLYLLLGTETSSILSLYQFLCPLSARPLCSSALFQNLKEIMCSSFSLIFKMRHVLRKDIMLDQHLNYCFICFFLLWNVPWILWREH